MVGIFMPAPRLVQRIYWSRQPHLGVLRPLFFMNGGKLGVNQSFLELPDKRKRPCSLDFLREWRTLTNPPSVMNEIRICRSYKYYHIREICPNYGNVLKEL